MNSPQNDEVKFKVHLEEFSGPFDVLLSMLSKHQLDITHISLSKITDEFVEFVKTLTGETQQLEEISSFILIAATLLDIKAARLLPGEQDFDEEDLELLEARDLLFAKLLQYKAFKDVAFEFQKLISEHSMSYPRDVAMEEKFTKILPPLNFSTDKTQLALLAANAFTNYKFRTQNVNLEHIHMRQVNVAEQGIIICKKLAKSKRLTFKELIKGSDEVVIIIGRFLSLLELYKMNAIDFEQKKALGELEVIWVADESFDFQNALQGSDFDTPITKTEKQVKE